MLTYVSVWGGGQCLSVLNVVALQYSLKSERVPSLALCVCVFLQDCFHNSGPFVITYNS